MSFQAFLSEIEKGLPSPVYLLYASEPFFHREAVEAIKRFVPENERDFNLHIFDLSSPEEERSLQQIIDVANTVSFFSGRRITVMIRNIQKFSKKDFKILNDYISCPLQNSVFIMLHDRSLKKETRDKFRALKPISLDLRESEIPLWVKQRARSKGLEISDEAADYLIGLIGPDIGFLSAEIEKISLLGTGRINIDDIADIIAGGRSYSIFDLVDALEDKDAERAFKIYKTLREITDDYSLIGALNWQYTRTLVAGGRQTGNEYLFRLFEILHMADKDIKSSGRTYPMEYLFVRLLRLREGSPGAKGRLPSL